jgi:hypothetical protein
VQVFMRENKRNVIVFTALVQKKLGGRQDRSKNKSIK